MSLLFSLLFVFCIFSPTLADLDDSKIESIPCGGKKRSLSKPEALDHINKCVKGEIDEEQCLNATKPEVLLHKIFKLINTRYEKDNNIEKFEECAAKIHESVPWEYVRVMHRHNQYSTGRNKHRCISIDQICRDNSKYLIPFACFVKKNCDRSIADLGYAMQYAFQQISLEQEGPIRCSQGSDDSQFDLNPEAYDPEVSLKSIEIVNENLCNGVAKLNETLESNHKHTLPLSVYERLLSKKGKKH
ncbi:unnamed protein product [Bursaphelenchus xylophilus]|uniref:(pine wood nematode) hypothetical protein n=1 Tax=Bursaphelenchus xylophilus TaxID=6326 RepID=A0A7I8WY92_BURXY|nr:unnamed protein product [Bursaphelenchus xylophilus]CAG9100447.1 unnamed protein product [Bursaphelenchus xylophilus]